MDRTCAINGCGSETLRFGAESFAIKTPDGVGVHLPLSLNHPQEQIKRYTREILEFVEDIDLDPNRNKTDDDIRFARW